MSEDDMCPICYEENPDYITEKCNHKFHKKCLDVWLQNSYVCPLCRGAIKREFKLYNYFYIKRKIVVYDYLIKIEDFTSKNYITGNNLKSVYLNREKKFVEIVCKIKLKKHSIKLYGKLHVLESFYDMIVELIEKFTKIMTE